MLGNHRERHFNICLIKPTSLAFSFSSIFFFKKEFVSKKNYNCTENVFLPPDFLRGAGRCEALLPGVRQVAVLDAEDDEGAGTGAGALLKEPAAEQGRSHTLATALIISPGLTVAVRLASSLGV